MIRLYYKTHFETKIENLLLANGILDPSDLTIENLAHVFNIKVVNMPDVCESAIWDDECSVIFLDSNKTLPEQREVFFHELVHLLLHSGDQVRMLDDFRELQEWQAKNFQLYAAMPFYMIKEIELPNEESWIIYILSDVFYVTFSLAEARWKQIKRRIYFSLSQNNPTHHVRSRIWSITTLNKSDKPYYQSGALA